MDDAEGLVRLNLFDAVSGYGAFPEDVTVTLDSVTLDSVTGTFGESDVFRNNISGDGGLTKAGDGELVLAGDNSFAGDVAVEERTITAKHENALGSGNVKVNGTLVLDAANGVNIAGDLAVAEGATLVMTVYAADASFNVEGTLTIAGDIEIVAAEGVELPEDYNPFN